MNADLEMLDQGPVRIANVNKIVVGDMVAHGMRMPRMIAVSVILPAMLC